QGTITLTGEKKQFRLNNVSLNGTGKGLNIISTAGNHTHILTGEINISGNVTINQTLPNGYTPWCASSDSHWNVSALNLIENAHFTFIKYVTSNRSYPNNDSRSFAGVHFNGLNNEMSFNIARNAKALFKLKPAERTSNNKGLPYKFNSNITASGEGSVLFDMHANLSGKGAELKMSTINISGGINFTLQSHVRNNDAFKITKNLTINATGSNFTLKQTADDYKNGYPARAINTTSDLTILGGNVNLGGQNSSSNLTGNITIGEAANVTLEAYNGGSSLDYKDRTTTFGNLTVKGNLSLVGAKTDIRGNLSVFEKGTFKGVTSDSLSITGTFTNDGDSEINISQGAVNLGNITNNKSLSITTNAKNGQKSIIRGDIINKKGNLNITDNNSNAEIEIAGNISQKEGNLTISSDKINITKQITIKAGVDGESSSSSTASDANLTIKTKELTLTDNLNISGFNKAEITAKDNSDLTIGSSNSDNSNTDAKKVTFNQVKDSKISAGNHNVTLNSKVETSGSNDEAESNSDNDTGLTINAKNVTVNKDITSNKTVNITASEKLTTKADATINATTGGIEVTAKTGDIQGEVKSTSGNVNITARGDALKVSNVTGQNVTVTASSGTVTTAAGSTINATTGNASITTNTGNINGKVESSSGSVTLTATGETLTVGNISGNAVTITANDAKLTTQAGSTINGTNGVTASSKSGDIGGTISGNTVNVSASGDLTTKSGSKIEAKKGEANVTSATGTIGGTISGNTVSVTATDSLTTQASSSITSSNGQTTLTAKNGSIAGSIDAANVTLNTTGTLTTVAGSNIKATSGTLAINAKDAKLDGTASGDRTVVNATNASGSGSVTAKTSSNVNITGDLSTINGLNIISKNGKNTVVLKGAEIDVKYIQPGVASANEVIEAKRALEKVKDLSDEERETLAKLGVSAVRFIEPNNTITVNTQNEFTTRPSSQVTISEGKACFSSGNGAAVCTNVADDGQQ
ncbi:TPA: beta strand repeat-containing protein, partial [Haemophilus influenzae]